MEFGFTEEQEKLRKEFDDFLRNELPEDFDGHVSAINEALQSFNLNLEDKITEKGWLVPGWPNAYGMSTGISIASGIGARYPREL